MSLHWQFSAFPAGTFERVFGHSASEAIAEFLEVIAWAGTDGADIHVGRTQELARNVLARGLNYQGRSEEESKRLDDLVSLALSPEGRDALGLAKSFVGGSDGPDHAWAKFAKKATRSIEFKALRWLERGRRWGTTIPCADVWGAHLVLSPGEAALLAPELQEVIAEGVADPGYREHVEQGVLPQLSALRGQNVELVGHSG